MGSVKSHERPWRVNVNEELLERFEAALERLGINQKEGTSRLIKFFIEYDQDVQALIMQILTPPRRAQMARVILREMGKRR